MKSNFHRQKHLRSVLDRLDKKYTTNEGKNFYQSISDFPLSSFQGEESEYIFQLMEAVLRATDAGQMKIILQEIKKKEIKRWSLIYEHAKKIESGKTTSKASHQLIVLIELIEEN